MLFNKKYIYELIDKNRIGLVIKLLKENKNMWSIQDLNVLYHRLHNKFIDCNDSCCHGIYPIFYYMSEFIRMYNDNCDWNVSEWKKSIFDDEDEYYYSLTMCCNISVVKYIQQKTQYQPSDMYHVDICKYIVEKSQMFGDTVDIMYGFHSMTNYVDISIIKYMYTDYVMNLDCIYCKNHNLSIKFSDNKIHEEYLMSDEITMRYKVPYDRYTKWKK